MPTLLVLFVNQAASVTGRSSSAPGFRQGWAFLVLDRAEGHGLTGICDLAYGSALLRAVKAG